MVARLESGTYEAIGTRTVTVWPKPDPDGDGEVVWEDETDADGNVLGRNVKVTDDGREIKHYLPPDGFVNIPTRDPGQDGKTENYVKNNGRGGPARNVHGEAIGIREGTALVEYPDGTHEVLGSDYAQVLFGRAHRKNGDAPAPEESS